MSVAVASQEAPGGCRGAPNHGICMVLGRWDAENHGICMVVGRRRAENHVICVVVPKAILFGTESPAYLPAYLPPYLPAYRPTLHKWPGLVPKAILSGTESPTMVSYSRACHCRRTPNLRTQVQEPVVSCWGFPGGPGSPQEVPGGRRRQPRKHQETPEEAPGAAGGARRVPRCPKPRNLHGLGTLRCPKPRYLRGFWPLGCRKPRNLRGCWLSGCRKPRYLRGFWPLKCPKPRYQRGGPPKVDGRLTQG